MLVKLTNKDFVKKRKKIKKYFLNPSPLYVFVSLISSSCLSRTNYVFSIKEQSKGTNLP